MSTVKSNADHLTLNADGASKDIKFQANGVEKASISSTGAFTSTSIDATKLTGNLPAISGASLTNLPGGGKVLQVVQTVFKADIRTTSNAYQSVGYSVTITPTSTSSKILVRVSGGDGYTGSSGRQMYSTIYRGATQLGHVNGGMERMYSETGAIVAPHSYEFLDSPATTSATTYTPYFKSVTSEVAFSLDASDATITVMEIGA